VKEGIMGEKWPIQFCLQHATSTVSVGIFYMPQIYDMRQTADGFTSPPNEGMLKIFSPKKSNGFGRV
jgi:hypothetical protein